MNASSILPEDIAMLAGTPTAFGERPDATATTVLPSNLEHAVAIAEQALGAWRRQIDAERPWLLALPDIGPSCEVLLLDPLVGHLSPHERRGLTSWIRSAQAPSGAWLDAHGQPDLSLTSLAAWALMQAGDDASAEHLVKAIRVVHALGGAQRGGFHVRLWLALAGHIPWAWLPAVPSELWMLPPWSPLGMHRISPWARDMLTAYLVLAHAPARLNLADASMLILRRTDGSPIPPRLTRAGLAGDMLQAFDRTVKLTRKLPRGPLHRAAFARAVATLESQQQAHGGWFSVRPTIAGILALRTLGATSDDPRVLAGLRYLRAARGECVRDGIPLGCWAQALHSPAIELLARTLESLPHDEALANRILRAELDREGAWQRRADAPVGGWPLEAGGGTHLDLSATLAVLDAFAMLPHEGPLAAAAWAATRRATDVVLAMQEPDGSFARFERGETHVPLRHLPWSDADLLAFGSTGDESHVELTARCIAHLARTGFRADDDRIARALVWLDPRTSDKAMPSFAMTTLTSLARAAGRACSRTHRLRLSIEQELRRRQREDGGFGDIVATALALQALLELGPVCVQARRAASFLIRTTRNDPSLHGDMHAPGLGLSPVSIDVSAGARETLLALRAFASASAGPRRREQA